MDISSIMRQLSGVTGGDPNKLIGAVSGLIGNSSGLSNLLSELQRRGLGTQVDSWVGKGQNQPADPDQLASALGADKVGAVADQAGVSQDEAKTGLAAVLPQLIDQLTPDGTVPSSGVGGMLESLKGTLGR